MNGEVDASGRALIVLRVRQSVEAEAIPLTAWVDTAFTGELVVPRRTIERLRLPKSAAVMAGLADAFDKLILITRRLEHRWGSTGSKSSPRRPL